MNLSRYLLQYLYDGWDFRKGAKGLTFAAQRNSFPDERMFSDESDSVLFSLWHPTQLYLEALSISQEGRSWNHNIYCERIHISQFELILAYFRFEYFDARVLQEKWM